VALCAHPEGILGVSAGRDGTVRLWHLPVSRSSDASQESQPQSRAFAYLKDLEEDLLCVSWSPDAQALAVGSAKGSLYLLNAHDLSVRTALLGDASGASGALSAITATCFRPDGQYVASACFRLGTGGDREGSGGGVTKATSAAGRSDNGGMVLAVEITILITFVGKRRAATGTAQDTQLTRIEKGVLPPQMARGVPVAMDWSLDGKYLQVCTRERELFYWCVAPHAAITPSFASSLFHASGNGGRSGGGGREGMSVDVLQAWDEFESSMLAACASKPGQGWCSWT